jgi:hypothetical protein
MRLKRPDVIFDEKDPFLHCKLERKQYALVLTEIVRNTKDGFVMALNNEWGTGKTTFVKMWKGHLKQEGFKTLYFNAWENDFQNDVFVSLVSEMRELDETKAKKKFDKFVVKAAPLAKSFASGLIKTQIKKHVGNEFVEMVLNKTTDTVLGEFQDQLSSYVNRKKGVKEFKEGLIDFAKSSSNSLPIVFIIDELDRCRPSYAVELLEQIKHIFSVPDVIFVLSIDKIQLGHAVCGFYGSDNIDSEEYLRRFIDIEYSIPKPPTRQYCKFLYEAYNFDSFFYSEERLKYGILRNDASDFVDFSAVLFEHSKLTLRMQQKIFAHARLALCSFNSNEYLVPKLFVFLIFLRIKHHLIYDKLKRRVFNLQGLISEIGKILPHNMDKDDKNTFLRVLAKLVIVYNNSIDRERKELLIEEDTESPGIITHLHSVLDSSPDNKNFAVLLQPQSSFDHDTDNLMLDYFINRIDLIDPYHSK